MARLLPRTASFLRRLVLPALLALLTSSQAHAGSVTLAWDANTESDLAGYVVSWGIQPGTYTGSQDVHNVVTFVVPNLTAGQRYYFAVQAYNTSGLTSPYSAEVSATIPNGSSAPSISAVTPTSGSIQGGTTVTITGTGFTTGTAITFGGSAARSVTFVSATQLTAVSPAHASGTVDVVAKTTGVANAGTLTGGYRFKKDKPGVLTLSPTAGKTDGGSTVTISGSGFTSATMVTFDGVVTSMTVVDDATLKAVVPAHSKGVVPVLVTNDEGTASDPRTYTYVTDDTSSDQDGDGLPDLWEAKYGLDPGDATGDNGASGDPDQDGATNTAEYLAGTHPRGLLRRYFAEGISSTFFTTVFAFVNPADTDVPVVLRFFRDDGEVVNHEVTLAAHTRVTLDARSLPSIADAAFSTTIESDVPVVADRTVSWDTTGYGGHAETATESAPVWYLAEGATHSGFDLFYLIQNPNPVNVPVQIRYLLPSGDAVVKTYNIPETSRFNIWVDLEDRRLAATDVSAVITSLNGLPIVVERSMYLNAGGLAFGAGHNSAGVTTPSTRWFLAEGATGNYFDTFILVANPTNTAADVKATYLLPTGETVEKQYRVNGNSRFNIWVDLEDAKLADTAVSTSIESTNGVNLIVERTMWWPAVVGGSWTEAHNSPGTTRTSTRWALAEGELGGPQHRATYILLANTSTQAGPVRVTLLFEDGSQVAQDFDVAARSRFNVDVAALYPAAAGKRFGAVVESLGASPVELVVERAMYWDAGTVHWAAGTNAVATALTPVAAPASVTTPQE